MQIVVESTNGKTFNKGSVTPAQVKVKVDATCNGGYVLDSIQANPQAPKSSSKLVYKDLSASNTPTIKNYVMNASLHGPYDGKPAVSDQFAQKAVEVCNVILNGKTIPDKLAYSQPDHHPKYGKGWDFGQNITGMYGKVNVQTRCKAITPGFAPLGKATTANKVLKLKPYIFCKIPKSVSVPKHNVPLKQKPKPSLPGTPQKLKNTAPKPKPTLRLNTK